MNVTEVVDHETEREGTLVVGIRKCRCNMLVVCSTLVVTRVCQYARKRGQALDQIFFRLGKLVL